MWLSRGRKEAVAGEAAAESGPVTVQGTQTAVYLSGERRNVAVCAPGGFAWRPRVGQEVLVLKAGQEQESPYVLGTDCAAMAEGLTPGETLLGGEGASVKVGRRVELTGQVLINGESLEELIRRVANPPVVTGG